MSNYLLLRDNQQSGPYSLEKLAELGLQRSDLIWVQGKSNGWVYAGEIEELTDMVRNSSASATAEVQSIYPALPSDQLFINPRAQNSRASETPPTLETKYSRPLDEIKEMYVQHLEKKGKTKWYKAGLVASIAATILLSGFVIKKLVIDKPEKIEIKAADTPTSPGEPVTNSQNFQNALSKEFIPIEVKPKKVKPVDLKKLVAIESNDYHVKLLGGIKDLKLTVQNYSEHLLDKVIIKVDYLKPKGEVVNSEVVIVRNIKSQDSKSVDVPPSARGVKVKYTILHIDSQEYKAVLEEV